MLVNAHLGNTRDSSPHAVPSNLRRCAMPVTSDDPVLAKASRESTWNGTILHACSEEFRSKFNLHPFKFIHTLHQSGLFEIPRIVDLAQRMLEKNGNVRAICFKDGAVHTKFSAMPHSARVTEPGRSGTSPIIGAALGQERRQYLGEYQHPLLHEISGRPREGLSSQLRSAHAGPQAIAAWAFTIARQPETKGYFRTGRAGSKMERCESRVLTAACTQSARRKRLVHLQSTQRDPAQAGLSLGKRICVYSSVNSRSRGAETSKPILRTLPSFTQSSQPALAS
jgi:hypothetical protein